MTDPKDQFLYPAPKAPNVEGFLPLNGTHKMWYAEYGNPDGIPIVYMHGGPGGGHGDHFPRYFDPDKFRIIVYDQRGSGNSLPAGEIKDNSPDHLIADADKLREHLGIDKWHVYGGSWGSTLALLYAEEHPERTESLTLRGIFLMRKRDIEMFYEAAALFRPAETKRLMEFLPAEERDNFFENFYKRLVDPDPKVHIPAAQAWARYETVSAFLNVPSEEALKEDDQAAVNVARIEAHFFRNHLFTPDDRILKNVDRIRHIPTYMVQGEYDLVCPPQIAHDLKQAFPEAHLDLVQAGHAATEPEIMKALVAATKRIAATGSPMPPAQAAATPKPAIKPPKP